MVKGRQIQVFGVERTASTRRIQLASRAVSLGRSLQNQQLLTSPPNLGNLHWREQHRIRRPGTHRRRMPQRVRLLWQHLLQGLRKRHLATPMVRGRWRERQPVGGRSRWRDLWVRRVTVRSREGAELEGEGRGMDERNNRQFPTIAKSVEGRDSTVAMVTCLERIKPRHGGQCFGRPSHDTKSWVRSHKCRIYLSWITPYWDATSYAWRYWWSGRMEGILSTLVRIPGPDFYAWLFRHDGHLHLGWSFESAV